MSDTKSLIQDYLQELSAYRQWYQNAKKSINYCLGDQWKKSDRAIVEGEGRPALTFNKIASIIQTVSGFQRQNRQDIKVVGVEGGDEQIAEIMTLLIKNIMTRNYGEYKVSQMFTDGVMSSRGWIEAGVNYDDDPSVGKIEIFNGMYDELFPDPGYREYDLERDAEFLIKRVRVTKARLLSLFPEKERQIKAIQAGTAKDDFLGVGDVIVEDDRSERRQLFTLVICWYKKHEKKKYVVDLLSGESKELAGMSTRDQRNMLEAIPTIDIISRRVSIPYRAVMVEDIILEDEISPYWPECKSFPVVPYVAYFNPVGRTPEKVFRGLVSGLIDPQNEINKRRSQLLNVIGNTPWVGDEDALTSAGWEKLEKRAASPRLTLKVKQGRNLQRISPVVSGQEYLYLVQEGSETLKEISGVAGPLVMQGPAMSGKALAIREQSTITAIQSLYDNLRYSRHILGRLYVGMILNSYTPEKIVRVVGEEKINIQGAEDILNNFDMREYDLAMDETQLSPVMRMAVMEELLGMRQLGIPISDDLVVEASNLPNREEIKARIQPPPVAPGMAGEEPVPPA